MQTHWMLGALINFSAESSACRTESLGHSNNTYLCQ